PAADAAALASPLSRRARSLLSPAPPPPPPPLFPYTTLFRSRAGPTGSNPGRAAPARLGPAGFTADGPGAPDHAAARPGPAGRAADRKSTRLNSSHLNLVCRLLLEKKKKNHNKTQEIRHNTNT